MLPGALLAFPSTVASFCCRPRLLLLLLLLLPELGVDGWCWCGEAMEEVTDDLGLGWKRVNRVKLVRSTVDLR